MEKTEEEKIQEIKERMSAALRADFEKNNSPYITIEEEGSEDE